MLKKQIFNVKIIAPIICEASAEVLKSYQQAERLVDKIKNKGVEEMVNIEQIKADIEALKTLTAEEYCKPQVETLYAEFEASREKKIAELESALDIFNKYQVEDEVEQEVAEEVAVEQAINVEA